MGVPQLQPPSGCRPSYPGGEIVPVDLTRSLHPSPDALGSEEDPFPGAEVAGLPRLNPG